MTPREYELFIANLLWKMGHTTIKHTGRSGDHGADILSTDENGRVAVVQCKYYDQPLSESIVRDLAGSVKAFNADHGMLFTNSILSDHARQMAMRLGIDFYERVVPEAERADLSLIEQTAIRWASQRKMSEPKVESINPSGKLIGWYEVKLRGWVKEHWYKKPVIKELLLSIDAASLRVLGYDWLDPNMDPNVS